LPVKQWAKATAVFARLPELAKDVKQLIKDVESLKDDKKK